MCSDRNFCRTDQQISYGHFIIKDERTMKLYIASTLLFSGIIILLNFFMSSNFKISKYSKTLFVLMFLTYLVMSWVNSFIKVKYLLSDRIDILVGIIFVIMILLYLFIFSKHSNQHRTKHKDHHENL